MLSRGIVLICTLLICACSIQAQKRCASTDYYQNQISADPLLASKFQQIEDFNTSHLNTQSQRGEATPHIIKVPVVFHVLYHTGSENTSTQRIEELLEMLNRDFRRRNADSVNTPERFVSLAADMEIEFYFAISDPNGRNTTGIERKYTPVSTWLSDDKMKFSNSYGADAWDSRYYLNIWLCNMEDIAGYSTLPGGDMKKDGVVLDFQSFSRDNLSGSTTGRTIVHEVGHWLNLRHIWGDTYCGDDRVDDTPQQSYYTPGCPSGIRQSCGSDPRGDMYMNYMDFTNDDCMNMFTEGQKLRARNLFISGGARESILSSKGLSEPTNFSEPAEVTDPQWMEPKLYPNPAKGIITLDLEYDARWIGYNVRITDISGRLIMQRTISSGKEQIDVSKLNPGMYIIWAKSREDKFQIKFIKQ